MIGEQPTTTAEPPALVEYRSRTRRHMAIYVGCIAATLLVIAGAVVVAYARGDINHVHWKTADAPSDVPPASVSASLTQRWRTEDTAASGTPVWQGIVVTYDKHSVNGRDALTGDLRWHYTRTDRTLCAVVQQDATTTAVYRHDGNCDEVTGFVTATGERKFWRTLTDNGDISVSSAPNVVVIVSDTNVHVIDNAGGLDRWNYQVPAGCAVDRALAGSLGVLVGFHCGSTWRLISHDLIQGDKDKTVAKWDVTLNFAGIPILADTTFAVIDRDNGDLVTVSTDKGAVTADLPLLTPNDPAISTLPRSETTQVAAFPTRTEFAHVGSTLYAFTIPAKQKKPSMLWQVPSDGPVTQLFDARLAVVHGGAVTIVRGPKAAIDLTVGLSPAPTAFSGTANPRVFGLGPGLVLCGNGVEVYQ